MLTGIHLELEAYELFIVFAVFMGCFVFLTFIDKWIRRGEEESGYES